MLYLSSLIDKEWVFIELYYIKKLENLFNILELDINFRWYFDKLKSDCK